jgi:hypothetical protein
VKLTLLFAGLFFGGAIDHAILASAGAVETPYGLRVGIAGNWALAALDLLLTGVCWAVHLSLEHRDRMSCRTVNKRWYARIIRSKEGR